MPCNMPAEGASIAFRAAAGDESLGQLLRSVIAELEPRGYVKINAVLDLDTGEYCAIQSILIRQMTIALCVECAEDTYRGEEAAKILASKAGNGVIRGYIEALAVTPEALDVDKSSEPDAFLRTPKPIEEILAGRTGDTTKKEPLEPPKREPEAAPTHMVEPASYGVEREVRGLAVEESSVDLATLITSLIVYSKLLEAGRDPEALIRKALGLSSAAEGEKFYRVSVHLKSGEIFNLFIKGGRLCSVVVVHPSGLEAGYARGMTLERAIDFLREKASKGEIDSIALFEVECPECAGRLLRECAGPGSGYESGTAESSAEAGEAGAGEGTSAKRERRRGLLSRLFGIGRSEQ